MKKKSLQLCKRIKIKTCLGFKFLQKVYSMTMQNQGGTIELWGHFFPLHSPTTILHILLLHLDFFHSSSMVLV